MSDITNAIEKFHAFSKAPTYKDQDFSLAVNKAGHNISASDIWADDIPMISRNQFSQESTEDLTTCLERVRTTLGAKKNDIVFLVGEAYTGHKFNGTDWETFTLSDGLVLKNSSGIDVIKYYSKNFLTALTAKNNSNATSNGYAARLWVNSTLVSSFVGITDKQQNGYPATGYAPEIFKSSTQLVEGTNYWVNSVGGMITFEAIMDGFKEDSTDPSTIYSISCFQYIGSTLGGSGSTGSVLKTTLTEENGVLTIPASLRRDGALNAEVLTVTDLNGTEFSGVHGTNTITLWNEDEWPAEQPKPTTSEQFIVTYVLL